MKALQFQKKHHNNNKSHSLLEIRCQPLAIKYYLILLIRALNLAPLFSNHSRMIINKIYLRLAMSSYQYLNKTFFNTYSIL